MRKVELPLAKGVLSPANGGNEGGVKTIERRDSKIRKGSPTYGKHVAVELTEDNHRQYPKGLCSWFRCSLRNSRLPVQVR